ncbi:MAG: glycosyltransferase [Bacteroidetes bacterium]|nr:glycosyltransferase [Bacteroidota bacterium]
MKHIQKKIAIIIHSLGKGGEEKASANLSILLSDLGFETHLISALNYVDYEYKGQLLNLGVLKDKDDSFFGRLRRFLVFYRYLKSERFDFIIDSRSRPNFFKQLLINKILYAHQKVVFVVHSYWLKNYLPKQRLLAKLLYNNAFHLVAVSEEIKQRIQHEYGFDQVRTIYNCLSKSASIVNQDTPKLPQNFILFFGRIEDKVKNISLLIDGYSQSKLAQKNIKLVILGDGPDVIKLQEYAKKLQLLEFIEFRPFVPNPSSIIKNAIFSVLTSQYEGFPMVLIESLSQGTPVVSVDCKSGPKEVIQNEINGLMVENHNPNALAKAFDRFLEDEQLYFHCKQNAKKSVEKFSTEIISKNWLNLLK